MTRPSPHPTDLANAAIVAAGGAAVVLTLAVWLAALLAYGVDVPAYDQWDTPLAQIVAFRDGTLSPGDLAVQHNEARKVVPNLVSVGLVAALGRFDTAAEALVGFLLSAVLVAQVWLLARRTFPDAGRAAAVTALFAALLLGPATVYFHFYSITFERLVPEVALMAMALSLARRGLSASGAATSIVAATLAQYSFPGGVALWGMPFLFALLAPPRPARAALLPLAAILAAGAVSTALYLAGYQRPPGHTSALAGLGQPPADMLRFVLAFTGNAVTGRFAVAVAFGAAACLALAAVFARFVLAPPPPDDRRVRAAWFLLAAYTLSQALLAMAGRLAMGIEHALRPDYVSHAAFLATAAAALVLAALPPRAARLAAAGAVALAAASAATLALPRFWDRVVIQQQELAHAAACLALSSLYVDEPCLRRLYPRVDGLLARAEAAGGLVAPERRAALPVPSGEAQGLVESVGPAAGDAAGTVVSGWAHGRWRPPAAVVAVAPDGTVAGIAGVETRRPDLGPGPFGVLGPSLVAGWSVALPPGAEPCAFRFLAFDPAAGTAAALPVAPGACPAP